MTDLPTRAAAAIRSGARRGGWMRDGVWTVLDQGLFAGANFAVNVLLARWLTPEAYGSFSVAFVVFLLIGTVHGGLLIEPMLVFGAGRFEGRLAPYLRVLLKAHAGYALVAGAVLAAIGGAAQALGSTGLGRDFLALSLAQGFILGLWLMRRACYVVSRPDWAATAGGLYLVLLLAGAFGLSASGALSGPTALGLMAVGSAVAALMLAARLGVFASEAGGGGLAVAAREAHIEYGRWSGTTGVLEWAHSALPFLVLPLFVGLQGTGTLRALYNLAMPALQAFAALTVLALPIFVRARSGGRLRRAGGRVSAGILGLGAAYGLGILLLGRPVVAWLYDGQYTIGTVVLVLLAAMPVASALSGVLIALLRSAERPEAVFRARAWAVGAASTVGIALTASLGVVGALASDLASLLVEAGVLGRAFGATPATSAPDRPQTERLRLRVLVSAFACVPGEGSEGGVGWNVAKEMARYHDLTVLTYGGYRRKIEAELAERPVPALTVAYYTLPFEDARYAVEGNQRSGVSEQIHYFLWQRGAARVARQFHTRGRFDLVHHVTYVKYWAPSALAGLSAPFIWGPVGGGESAPDSFYAHFSPSGRRYERTRDLARRLFEWAPSVRRTARQADLAFATTDETARRLAALGSPTVEVRSAIGLPQSEIDLLGSYRLPDDGPVRLLCIGRQIAFKGYRFGILAYAQALATTEADSDPSLTGSELWLIGDGPEHENLARLIEHLNLGDRVRLLGRVPRAEVMERLRYAHALLHPSLHESGGGVCLEAMAAGRPVIGFDRGGTAFHVPPDCGLLVPADDPEAAVARLAGAIRQLAASPEGRRAMGRAGRGAVAEQFCWEDKAADLAERYWEVADRPRLRVRDPSVSSLSVVV